MLLHAEEDRPEGDNGRQEHFEGMGQLQRKAIQVPKVFLQEVLNKEMGVVVLFQEGGKDRVLRKGGTLSVKEGRGERKGGERQNYYFRGWLTFETTLEKGGGKSIRVTSGCTVVVHRGNVTLVIVEGCWGGAVMPVMDASRASKGDTMIGFCKNGQVR